MGEPLSKICLVLLGLAMEEIAFSEYMGIPLSRTWTKPCKWRALHLGGDDHLAPGPLSYLKSITSNHRLFGSKISPTKHRISRKYIVYTEKILRIENTVLNRRADQVDRNPEDSTFIDSVKVRLLSPFTKATDSQNDRNIAIGKIRGISATLQYFSNREIRRSVFDRAVYRFAGYLPSAHHKTQSAVVGLPIALGGLGLSVDDSYISKLPGIFNQAIRSIIKGGGTAYRAHRALSLIFANRNPRGLSMNDVDWVSEFVEQVLDYPGSVEMLSRTELLDRLDPNREMSWREFTTKAQHESWVSLRDIPRIAEKPFLMKRLLEGKEVPKYFRTETNKKRIAHCWTSLEKLEGLKEFDDSELCPEDIKIATRAAKQVVFMDLSQITSAALVDTTSELWDPEDPWLSADFIDISYKELLTYGEPSLNVPLSGTDPDLVGI